MLNPAEALGAGHLKRTPSATVGLPDAPRSREPNPAPVRLAQAHDDDSSDESLPSTRVIDPRVTRNFALVASSTFSVTSSASR